MYAIYATGASAKETANIGAIPTKDLHTFTLDSGTSRCFFRDCTTVTPLTAPVRVTLADPSSNPVVGCGSIVLPRPTAPSGSLTIFHLPLFATNLSLSPLPLSLALPYTPCVEGRQRAAPHSSFPLTAAPLQTVHMDVWVLLALVHDPTTGKLSPRTIRCVFLGFPTDALPKQFYNHATRRVMSSRDVTCDELVCYYCLFPHRNSSVPPRPSSLFQGGDPAVDDTVPSRRSPRSETPPGPRSSSPPLQPVAVDSGAVGGGDSGGAGLAGAGPGGGDSGFAGSGGAGSGGADSRGADLEGAVSGGTERSTGGGVKGTNAGGSVGALPPLPQRPLLWELL
ncbi:unnamed protein product [Closterium sp. NIES-54]